MELYYFDQGCNYADQLYIVEVNLISETDIFPGTGSCPAYEDVFGGYMKGKL